jgi:N-acylneuraminate cytidylyltransferase
VKATAIILARAGSKGVPGKNVRAVAGKPCIAWTILHAQRSARVGRVVVSTDDATAAGVARAMGAEVVERPADLAHDTARVDDAARHAVRELERGQGGPGAPGTPLVILYANVPVRPADLTDRALALLDEGGCDSVQSYQGVGKHHPWWTARLGEGGRVVPWEGEVLNHGVFRRQDLPAAFVPDGGVIALTRAALMLEVAGVADGPHAFFGKDRRGVVNPEGSVVDIDTEIDLLVADALLRGRA